VVLPDEPPDDGVVLQAVSPSSVLSMATPSQRPPRLMLLVVRILSSSLLHDLSA
jgi:hypothetical protein